MNYEKIKDCIVVVPSKARKYVDEFEIGDKAKKYFSVASDKVMVADEFLSNKSIVDKMLCALGSFAAGLLLGMASSKAFKRMGYALLVISGIGILYFSYKKFFED